MADYRELLMRAVAALPENNGAARRQVYEKARSALVGQLRAIQPPLPAREITQHRLQLEDCIRQVEQDATDALLSGLKQLDDDVTSDFSPVVEDKPAPVVPEKQVAPISPAPVASEVVDETPVDDAETIDTDADVAADDDQAVAEALGALEGNVDKRVEQTSDEVVDIAFDATENNPEPVEGDAAAEPSAPETENVGEAVALHAEEMSSPSEKRLEDDIADDLATVDDTGNADEIADALQVALEEKAVEPTPAPTPPAAPIGITAVTEQVPAEAVVASAPSALPREPKPGSIDYLIAQAQAAATRAATPARWRADEAAHNDVSGVIGQNGNTAVAMSSVLEVDVDDADADGDPQIKIDRAIETLDREARGDNDGAEEVANGAAAAAAIAEVQDSGPAKTAKRDGGNGSALTIFLVIFAVLLAGVGGAGYWAWREGYVDLDAMFAQADPVVAQNTTATPDVSETATPQSDGPGNTEATPNAVAPINQEMGKSDERLAATPEAETQPVVETPSAPVEAPTETPPNTVTEVAEADPVIPAETNAPANGDVKVEDRLTTETPATNVETPAVATGDAETAAPSADIVPVGGQSLLLEASSSGTTGAVPFSGTVDWSRGVDELGQPTLLAHANIPARNLDVDVVISRNNDPTLPASHLMEVNFTVSDSFFGGEIAGMPGVLLKDEELVKGVPLVGASVRILANSFLFALSAADTDMSSNTKLLRDRKWIDLAMVYSTGNRAIITLEKDKAAQAVFAEVMDVWAADAAKTAANQ